MPTLTVPVTIDSFISGVQTTTNFGALTYIVHGVVFLGGEKFQWRRGIVNFDVSELAGATIESAMLVRTITSISGAGGVGARLSRCKRAIEWTENGVTWNAYDGVNLWTAGGGDFDDATPVKIDYDEPSTTGDHEIAGLGSYVEDALQSRGGIVSLITRLQDEDPGVTQELLWSSKEQGANGWRLVVEYARVSPGRRSAGRTERSAGARRAMAGRPAPVGRPARPFQP